MTATADEAPVKRRPGRPRKAAAAVNFQQPLTPPTAKPRLLDGVEVVDIIPIAPLGPDKPMRIVKIHLADGRMLHGCRDCADELDFTGTRGDVMAHRNRVHGAQFGKKRPKIDGGQQELPEVLDTVLTPRTDGSPAPDGIYQMTIAEVVALMPSIKAMHDLIEKVEGENDKLLHELNSYRAFEKANRAKLDAYEQLHDEVVGLRVQIRQWSNYEAIKAEMYELKGWKKKIITKLRALGFQLTDEEQ